MSLPVRSLKNAHILFLGYIWELGLPVPTFGRTW